MSSSWSRRRQRGPAWIVLKTFEVAAARTCGLFNTVFSHHTGFSSASIYFLLSRWSFLSPLYQAYSYWAWVRNCIPAKWSACSTKIWLDSCSLFKYSKLEEAKNRLARRKREESWCGRVYHHLVLASKSKGRKIGFTAFLTSVKGKFK